MNIHPRNSDIFNSHILSRKVRKLETQDIHLWSVHCKVFEDIGSYSDLFLTENEQNRAKRFRFRKDHDLFAVGRYLTKVLIAYYAEKTPESVQIIVDSFGKPSCEMNLCFNISHSADQLLLGFSHSKIGIDIEKSDPSVDIEKLGRNHFSSNEFQQMMDSTYDKRVDSFFEIWTKKEALIKGIGKGLSVQLHDFNVTNPNGKVLWRSPAEKQYRNWSVQNIETVQGYKSAFATQKETFDLCYFCLDTIFTV